MMRISDSAIASSKPDQPVYLLHHTIPLQLQGIIRLLQRPHTSQVVIVHKKLGEISLVWITESVIQLQ